METPDTGSAEPRVRTSACCISSFHRVTMPVATLTSTLTRPGFLLITAPGDSASRAKVPLVSPRSSLQAHSWGFPGREGREWVGVATWQGTEEVGGRGEAGQ